MCDSVFKSRGSIKEIYTDQYLNEFKRGVHGQWMPTSNIHTKAGMNKQIILSSPFTNSRQVYQVTLKFYLMIGHVIYWSGSQITFWVLMQLPNASQWKMQEYQLLKWHQSTESVCSSDHSLLFFSFICFAVNLFRVFSATPA